MPKTIKLRQAQVWKLGAEYLRIVRLERLAVEYKATTTLNGSKGIHVRVTKKDFCRLIKPAELLPPAKPSAVRKDADPTPSAD